MDLNWQIIIKSNLRPILARKVQVFAIAPWRRRIGINAMYGGKRFLKPVEVHVGRFRTKVRPRGEFHLEKSSTFWTTARYLIRSVGGHVLFGLVIGLGWLSWQYGTPYLRTHYALTNQLNAPTPYQWCRYSGLESLTRMGGPCPLIILKKDW